MIKTDIIRYFLTKLYKLSADLIISNSLTVNLWTLTMKEHILLLSQR